MRAVFDGRAILNELDGTGRYTLNVLSKVADLLGKDRPVVLLRPDLDRRSRDLLPAGVKLQEIAYRHISPRTLVQLGPLVDSLGADLFHSPFMLQPLLMRTPGIITIHDAMWWKHPGLQAKEEPARIVAGWLYYRAAVHLCVAKARRIITVSEASRRDISECWPRALHKLEVVSEGVDPCFRSPTGQEEADDLLQRLNLGNNGFFLHITNARPYKNTGGLLRAFAKVADRCNHTLVVVGNLGRFRSGVIQTIKELGLENRTRIAGSVTDREVVVLMRNAACLAFPSLFEGFGLPVAEAMACGCPVLTSDRGALAEVAGDAAVIVDPTSVDSMGEGLLTLAGDARLREDLRQRGLARAERFTWSEAAYKIVAIYEHILRRPKEHL